MAGSRVLVQEGIYEKMTRKLVEKAKNWVVGDPFHPDVQQGPQVITCFATLLLFSFSFVIPIWKLFIRGNRSK